MSHPCVLTPLPHVPSCHCASEFDAVSALCCLLVSRLETPGPHAAPQVSADSRAVWACPLQHTLCLARLQPGVRPTLGGQGREEGAGCRLLPCRSHTARASWGRGRGCEHLHWKCPVSHLHAEALDGEDRIGSKAPGAQRLLDLGVRKPRLRPEDTWRISSASHWQRPARRHLRSPLCSPHRAARGEPPGLSDVSASRISI